jgi:hypothetical protein
LALVVTRSKAHVSRGSRDVNVSVSLNSRLGSLDAIGRVLVDRRSGLGNHTIEVLDGLGLLGGLQGVLLKGSWLRLGGRIERALSRSQERSDILLSTRRRFAVALSSKGLAYGGSDIVCNGEVLGGVANVAKGSSLGSCLEASHCHHVGEGSG